MSEAFQGYSGQAFSLRSEKGRFTLPPAFRNAVKLSTEDRRLCLTLHDKWNCLVGFGTERVKEFDAILDREEESAYKFGRDFDRDTRAMQLNSFETMPFDDSGRFIMPEFLRGLGEIDDALFFQGVGPFFTVWNPARLYEMGPEMAMPKAACRALEKEAREKGKKK
ncbi:division/cell wall cluster transcriptional repressor MraZ [Citromicrobium bathyomarinum]|uniref:division/cell wall cluster transcriptional repressor MraZ n=1 Tax=Citromicrobium bathyomarinum TaxID=72174 RepID=UPI00315A7D7B